MKTILALFEFSRPFFFFLLAVFSRFQSISSVFSLYSRFQPFSAVFSRFQSFLSFSRL
jgi:hypothetical protein